MTSRAIERDLNLNHSVHANVKGTPILACQEVCCDADSGFSPVLELTWLEHEQEFRRHCLSGTPSSLFEPVAVRHYQHSARTIYR